MSGALRRAARAPAGRVITVSEGDSKHLPHAGRCSSARPANFLKTEDPMSKPILILNGPNLNLLGTREPHIYGSTTLAQVEDMCRRRAEKRGLTIAFHQANSEATIIDWIHGGINGADGIIINPAAFTHTSIAILDALKMIEHPIIELHISNPHKR